MEIAPKHLAAGPLTPTLSHKGRGSILSPPDLIMTQWGAGPRRMRTATGIALRDARTLRDELTLHGELGQRAGGGGGKLVMACQRRGMVAGPAELLDRARQAARPACPQVASQRHKVMRLLHRRRQVAGGHLFRQAFDPARNVIQRIGQEVLEFIRREDAAQLCHGGSNELGCVRRRVSRCGRWLRWRGRSCLGIRPGARPGM